jgi:hypothetical protein
VIALRREFIVLHHSATTDGLAVSWGAIERYHRETNGWRDVGYHFGAELVGDRFYALVGRPEHELAAACKEAEMNARAIHVCLVGDFDKAPPPLAQLEVAVRRILLPVMSRHGISAERVIGHRDAGLMAGFDWRRGQYKSCPGKAFDLDLIRRLVR